MRGKYGAARPAAGCGAQSDDEDEELLDDEEDVELEAAVLDDSLLPFDELELSDEEDDSGFDGVELDFDPLRESLR